jgi:hypothetical protein
LFGGITFDAFFRVGFFLMRGTGAALDAPHGGSDYTVSGLVLFSTKTVNGQL